MEPMEMEPEVVQDLPEPAPIETINDQMVGVTGGGIVVLMPKRKMTCEEALRHAAWLVVLAEKKEGEFNRILEAVRDC